MCLYLRLYSCLAFLLMPRKSTKTPSVKEVKQSPKTKKGVSEENTQAVKVLADVIVYFTQNLTIGRKFLKGTKGVDFVASAANGDFIVKFREQLYLAKAPDASCFQLPGE